MAEPGDVERRLRRLEQPGAELRDDVDAARRDAAAARVLAAGADRDVSDVRVELRAELRAELAEAQRDTAMAHQLLALRGRANGGSAAPPDPPTT